MLLITSDVTITSPPSVTIAADIAVTGGDQRRKIVETALALGFSGVGVAGRAYVRNGLLFRSLTDNATTAHMAQDALHWSQAALNLAHACMVIQQDGRQI